VVTPLASLQGEGEVKWEWKGACFPCICVILIKQNQTRAKIFWSQFLILPGTSGHLLTGQEWEKWDCPCSNLSHHLNKDCLKTRKGIVPPVSDIQVWHVL